MRPDSFSSAEALLVDGLSDMDVLITDIGMPGMDGIELRDVVRKARPELPVFLITGRHEIADQERAQGIEAAFPQALRCESPACGGRRRLARLRHGGGT